MFYIESSKNKNKNAINRQLNTLNYCNVSLLFDFTLWYLVQLFLELLLELLFSIKEKIDDRVADVVEKINIKESLLQQLVSCHVSHDVTGPETQCNRPKCLDCNHVLLACFSVLYCCLWTQCIQFHELCNDEDEENSDRNKTDACKEYYVYKIYRRRAHIQYRS